MKTMYVGKIYHVKFTDHAMNCPDSIICEIFGRLLSYTDDAYIFTQWEPLSNDSAVNEENREYCTIVKAAVKDVVELIPKKRKSK
jgi:hypothetical protein